MAVRSFLLHVPVDSPFHRLHPLMKLFLLVVINVVACLIETPVMMIFLMALIFVGYKIARVPLGKLKKFLVLFFIVMQSITISYLVASRIPGSVVFFTFPWGTYISDLTIVYALTMVLRFFTMLVGSTLVLAVTRDRDITHAFSSLHLPYAVSFVVCLGFRTMSIFMDDFFKVREAMMLKGTDFNKGSIIAKARKYVYVGIPLAVIAVRRIIEMTNAVEAKGFTVSGKRTCFHSIPFRGVDVCLFSVMIALLTMVFVVRVYSNSLSFPGWPFVYVNF